MKKDDVLGEQDNDSSEATYDKDRAKSERCSSLLRESKEASGETGEAGRTFSEEGDREAGEGASASDEAAACSFVEAAEDSCSDEVSERSAQAAEEPVEKPAEESAEEQGDSRSFSRAGSFCGYEYVDEDFTSPIEFTKEQKKKLKRAEQIIGYEFKQKRFLLSAITHPSAVEGKSTKCSYERFEFLGDSILGAIVATIAFDRYHELNEGGLTRIKVALVSGSTLSDLSNGLGFSNVIVFGSSEAGTGRRGLHSALENVYEAVVAALFLDGGMEVAAQFVNRTLIPRMSMDLAKEPENPKSALQEKLQEDGITPTYKLLETQGPPHDRRFVAQVYAGSQGLGQGSGRTKKEAESQAAKSTLARLGEFFGIGLTDEEREQKAALEAQAKAEKAEAARQAKADKAAAAKQAKADKAAAKARKQQERDSAKAQ